MSAWHFKATRQTDENQEEAAKGILMPVLVVKCLILKDEKTYQ
jgi:hypothetical protein